jgi:FlaA1/EpsC-like NDP-sugar epimerase
MNFLSLIGRSKELFTDDIEKHEKLLSEIIQDSQFLVIGGAGSIGQAVSKEIFKRNPQKLHIVYISENNLVELVRDIRSSFGYINGDFQTFALDIGSIEYDAFWEADGQYDYVLNLSALKHVRSEKDPFTIMRMIQVNIFNTDKTIRQSIEKGVKKYFCVSTDKAANPVNMMGASKRIMEMFVNRRSKDIDVSMARFANVAFSDGSLLHGFDQRLKKQQPISAPNDIKRYFVIPKESGELCLMSCIFGKNREIFFPKLSEDLHLITFAEIAEKYLKQKGLEPCLCKTEDEARGFFNYLSNENVLNNNHVQWPCLFTASDTTGEKDFEEFFMEGESLDLESFENLGIVKSSIHFEIKKLDSFLTKVQELLEIKIWSKSDLVDLFQELLPEFNHKETGKYLDAKM